MKLYAFLLTILFLSISLTAHAVDVALAWNPVEAAEGYAIEKGTCLDSSWEGSFLDVGDVPIVDGEARYTYPAVPEDEFVIFRIAAYATGHQDALRTYSGAWYNHLWYPLVTPGGTGIQ